MPISRNRPKEKGPAQPEPQFNEPKFRFKPYLLGFKPGTVLEGPSGRMWVVSGSGAWIRIPVETAQAMRTARENHAPVASDATSTSPQAE